MKTVLITWLSVAILLAAAWPPGSVRAEGFPEIHAKAAAVIDVSSGRILYSYNGDKPMLIASLTKIMTAIVAIEHGTLSDKVKVSPRAYGVEGSSIYLKRGETITLENLLYGLMLRSGNDAAVAIAEHVGGSVEGFVYMMNEEARTLGLTHTHFANPNGLDAKGHYSSADDLAVLTAYALRNPTFRNIVKTKVKMVPNPDEQWDRTWRNKNKMLRFYDGADGVKTGYTKKAGRCLVSSATRGGQQVAVVTLDDGNDWIDHQRLLDYAFAHYPLQQLAERGDRVKGYAGVRAGEDFLYPLAEEERGQVKAVLHLEKQDSTGYRLGERGWIEYVLNGQSIGKVPVYAQGSPQLKAAENTVGGIGEAQTVSVRFTVVFQDLINRLFLRNDG